MTRTARAVWALVVTALLAAGVVAVRGALRPSGYTLVATFDDVGDLFPRHSVQIADVRIGAVERIALTKDFRARVRMRISPGVRVPQGSTAVLRTTSLLGEKFIELRPPSPEAAQRGPFLHGGDTIERTERAPEIESVAQSAIEVLGAVQASDVADLVKVGAEGFGQRRQELRSLVADLGTVSNTLAQRSGELGRIIDKLDGATRTLAGGTDDLKAMLANVARTTDILAANRDRAVAALDQLARVARAQNAILGPHFEDIQTQVSQVDRIVAELARAQNDVDSLLVWLERFVVGIPRAIPDDFTNVYLKGVLSSNDPRVGK